MSRPATSRSTADKDKTLKPSEISSGRARMSENLAALGSVSDADCHFGFSLPVSFLQSNLEFVLPKCFSRKPTFSPELFNCLSPVFIKKIKPFFFLFFLLPSPVLPLPLLLLPTFFSHTPPSSPLSFPPKTIPPLFSLSTPSSHSMTFHSFSLRFYLHFLRIVAFSFILCHSGADYSLQQFSPPTDIISLFITNADHSCRPSYSFSYVSLVTRLVKKLVCKQLCLVL
ncbi:unnamed protein product [Acanthosepion pharaonis]|uniref:Uncharacterized protein n=1 Tax=Acanthosepion pharaonis TaxID=158019 RepID=A0A812C420_ACAPH|nr:unnamed protein product [Sepia pharaonis]